MSDCSHSTFLGRALDKFSSFMAAMADAVTDGGRPRDRASEIIENTETSLSNFVDGALDYVLDPSSPGGADLREATIRDIHREIQKARAEGRHEDADYAQERLGDDWQNDNYPDGEPGGEPCEDENEGETSRASDSGDNRPDGEDPLIIDLDGDGVELVSLENSTALFDLDGNGFAERTGWVGADDALLVRDLNADGNIQDVSEIFGNTDGFSDGFLNLASLDENQDGIIDASDSVFSELEVWQDLDQDGISDAGELFSLGDVGIQAISLATTDVSQVIEGNSVSKTSTVTFADGSETSIVSTFFARDPYVSRVNLDPDFEFDTEALLMPQLFGTGVVASTDVAFTQDAELKAHAKDLLALLENGEIAAYHEAFDAFFLDWNGADIADPEGRGAYVDGRKLAALEAIYGQDFRQVVFGELSNNPGAGAGAQMNALYDTIRDWMSVRFLAQAPIASFFLELNNESDPYQAAAETLDHPLFELIYLVSSYKEDNPQLTGSLSTALVAISQMVQSGALTDIDAASIGNLLSYDFGPTRTEFEARVLEAGEALGLSLEDEYFARIALHSTHEFEIGTTGSDSLSVSDAGYFKGHEGDDTLTGGDGGNIFIGGAGNDTIVGGEGSDAYFYSLGDGSDVITDYDPGSNSATDLFTFTDVNPDDVTFSHGPGNDLTMTLSNGEVITVKNHFDSDFDYFMDNIAFADGTVLDPAGILYKTVADMKSTGTVIGTEMTDNYFHAPGDGSYTITDYDPGSNSATDLFTFTDVNPDDVTFSHGPGNDLTMTLNDGEAVTINNYFDGDGDYRIEEIRFADGSMYNLAGVQDKISQDARPEPNNGDAIDLTSELRDIATVTSSSSHSHGDNSELIDGLVSEDNFASTNFGADEWQKLDLGSEYSVNSIELTNRVIADQYASRLDGAVVSLLDGGGNTVHTFDPLSNGTSGSTHLLKIGEFKTVQSVLISHSNQYLSVAELKVFGTSSNVVQSTADNDTLAGTSNTDVFVFDDNFGSDQVTGFEDGTDLLRFEISNVAFEDIVITYSDGNSEIAVADQGVINLAGVDSSLLTEEDFVFL